MAGFLLDTNVISEMVKPRPNAGVLKWIARQVADELFLSAMTIGELVRGVGQLASGTRRRRLTSWIMTELTGQFDQRILSFDHCAAIIWGEIMANGDRTGRPRPFADSQIAAIAIDHELTLVTRNTHDFQIDRLPVLNPWD